MHEGVLLLGPDGRVLLSNPAGRDMLKSLGQSPDAPIALGEAKPQEIASIAAGKVRRWSISSTSPTKALRFAAAAVGVIDGGARLGTLVTLTDVTEEEQARRRLLHAEKLSVVGQTLASVAHELNNPLAAIVGYADLLAESQVTPEVERLLLRIREQATRTSRIVKNLLSVARRRGPERTRVSINEVVTSVIDLFAYDARLNNVLILPSLAPDLPAVMGDKHALQQVLVNLVQNALHALRGRTGGGRIEIRTSVDRGMAVASVRDDGPGISPENRAKIFEAFFTTKGPDEGTGLGLAISRGIAREHGGDLALEMPHEGPGAQFVMRVPIEQGEAAPQAETSAIPDGVPAHVLVVDDEAPVRESLVAQLGRLGAQVDSAATPLEASRLLGGPAPYDAVLMDVRLPGQSGLDVHRALRARNPVLAQRVVFMTGDLVNEDLLRELRETGNQVLEKPFTAEELRTALSRAGRA
jgi:two-component system NtrC family sensor kinase